MTEVRDLDMALGKVDPATGRAVADPRRPEPAGRLHLRPRRLRHPPGSGRPAQLPGARPGQPQRRGGGSDTGNDDGRPRSRPPRSASRDKVTDQRPNPFIAGYSQQSDFGNTVRITLYDLTDPTNPVYVGGYNPDDPTATADWGLTDKAGPVRPRRDRRRPAGPPGRRADPRRADRLTGHRLSRPRLPDGPVRLGVQATDLSGTRGPIATFQFTLDTTAPAAPAAP